MSRDNPSVVIYGTGGHSKVVYEILAIKQIPVAGFMDKDESRSGSMHNGRPYFGTHKLLGKKPYPFDAAVIAIGDNKLRKELTELFLEHSIPIISVVHPESIVSPGVHLGRGCCICAGAVVGPGTTLGEGVIINSGAVVDHDCELGDFTHVAPHTTLCGGVTCGKLTFIGAGATVIQEIKIGENTIIGAGSTVLSHIPSNVTAFGTPARLKVAVNKKS
ncbi:MAG: acetyltransferase [Deltaproteobacteria bacterium]|nr:acetyltransferase [Deltaproteobacteria bacterium]